MLIDAVMTRKKKSNDEKMKKRIKTAAQGGIIVEISQEIRPNDRGFGMICRASADTELRHFRPRQTTMRLWMPTNTRPCTRYGSEITESVDDYVGSSSLQAGPSASALQLNALGVAYVALSQSPQLQCGLIQTPT